MKRIIIAALLMLSQPATASDSFARENLVLNHRLYHLEIARTVSQRRQGLMYRQSIARDGGMLFEYARPGDYRIWMKNTLVPLTVIWLDAAAKIIDVKLLLPCRQLHCPVYGVKRASLFILELHPDQRKQFKPGQQLKGLLTRPSKKSRN